MKRSRLSAIVLVAIAAVLGSACGGGGGGSTLLAKVKDAGKVKVATDPAYPPQSSYDEASGKWQGFDVDVAEELAQRMGVEVEWTTPSWDIITAGNWNGRWDVSVGSMTPLKERQQVLDFTPPYYYVPAVVVVPTDSTVTSFDQLAGKHLGSCQPCTYSFYIERTLDIPGYPATYVLPEASQVTFTGYDTDSTALQDLKVGRLDAVVTSLSVAQGAIDAGDPFKILGDPVFYEPDSIAVDKNAPQDPADFLAELSKHVQAMHDDGTLSSLSQQWFGTDLTKTAPVG